MFDFLKFPKYKVEEVDNGQFIAYVRTKIFARWLGIDKNKPEFHEWFAIENISEYCLCDDEEEAVAVISAHTRKKLSVEEQIKGHVK